MELECLTRFVLAFCPLANVTTADLIPRATKRFFNHRTRLIAAHIIQQDVRRHHVSLLRSLLIISRLKGSEKYRPKELLFNGSDGVHMNSHGYRAVIMITEWLRRDGDSIPWDGNIVRSHNYKKGKNAPLVADLSCRFKTSFFR